MTNTPGDDFWLDRWRNGQIGWHERLGNESLRRHWATAGAGRRVLVPLCGKAVDMLWLARRGHAVTGVEISELAIKTFFSENELEWQLDNRGAMPIYNAVNESISLHCGDFFKFQAKNFDALFDRGAMVALSADLRGPYVKHCQSLMRIDACVFLITLEYDESQIGGPPYSLPTEQVLDSWRGIELLETHETLHDCSPKFREAGVKSVLESVWLRASQTGH